MSFNPKENRDAWFVIRGFVYQVDLTILKWINLSENQVIELERGEDIDVVTFEGKNIEKLRQLGQVKHRDSNITLGSPSILEILRNYYEHQEANPTLDLIFKFITNSKYGKEKPSIFPDGTKGIEAWIKLYEKQNLSETDPDLVTIQKHIIKRIKSIIKDDVSSLAEGELEEQGKWIRFKTFIEAPANFLKFVQNFEWSMENDSSEVISETVKSKILEYGLVDYPEQVEQIYPRLFLKVFKTLTEPKIKVLNWEMLRIELSLLEVKDSDEPIFEFIQGLLLSVSTRIDEFDERLLAVEIQSNKLELKINDPSLFDSSASVFNYQLSTLNIDKPSLINNGSKREAKVRSIMDKFTVKYWINFHGINGCGKSQLASLVAENFECAYWLDLRPYNSESSKCFSLVQAFLSSISGVEVMLNRKDWLSKVVATLKNRALIVFNDLPDLSGNEELQNLITSLVKSLENTTNRLLTTSNHRIKSRSIGALTVGSFEEWNDINFNVEEVSEFLTNIGAPSHAIESASLIVTLSHGNPRYVSAIIYHLCSKGWGTNIDESLISVLDKKITYEILDDEQDSINNLISDSETKELLYRLSLIYWSFGKSEITIVSSAPESIRHPNEKFRYILNVWIQELENHLYQVSPLIKNIGEQNLGITACRVIYKQLASSLVESRKVDPLTGYRSITLFIKAEDDDNAGSLLLRIYNSADSIESARFIDNWGFTQFWSDDQIPEKMNSSLAVKLKVEQIRINRLLNKDYSSILFSLRSLLEDKKLDGTDHLFLRLTLILNSSEPYKLEILEHIDFVLSNWKTLGQEFNKVIDIKILGSCLWFPIKLINNTATLHKWLELANKAEDLSGVSIFEDKHTHLGVGIIASQILNYENQTDKDWIRAEENLKLFAQYFENKNPVLEAKVLRELLSLLYDLKGEKSEALELTSKKIMELNTPLSTYFLAETIGKLLYRDKLVVESRDWFSKAIIKEAEEQINFVDTLLYGASAFSEIDKELAVSYCENAVEISSKNVDANELDIVLNNAELGVAYWLNGDTVKAFNAFSHVVETLYDIKETKFDDYWVRLFKWTGHALGYISAEMLKDKVPEKVSDGGEYVKPYQGIFAFNTKDLTDFYDPTLDAYLCVHMAMIADAVGEIEKTYYWSQRGFDIARKSSNQSASLMISNVCAPYMIINFKVAESIETQLLASAISGYIQGNKNRLDIISELDLNKLYSQKPNKLWSDAEDTTMTFGIVPLFILLLTKLIKKEDGNPENDFFAEITDYLDEASDKESWKEMLEVMQAIVNRSATMVYLVDQAQYFWDKGKSNHRNLCILGMIYLERPNKETIVNLLNVIPFVFNISMSTRSKIKYIILPFVKERCLETIKREFVGKLIELEDINNKINEVDNSDPFSVQEVLRQTVLILEINVAKEREKWLYNNEVTF